MDLRLKGTVALVTGSNKGIGYSIASALARQGCKVVVNARDSQAVEEAAAEIRKAGAGTVHGIAAKITVAAEADRLIRETVSHFGTIFVATYDV